MKNEDRASLIIRWQNAADRVKNAKSELNSAECELDNARNVLGKSLCPKDSQVGERFHIWLDNNMIEVEVVSWAGNEYKVRWRDK